VTAVATAQHVAFERATHRGVQDVLEDPRHRGLELVGVRTAFDDAGVVTDEQSVTVVVSRSADGRYPALADDLTGRVVAATAVTPSRSRRIGSTPGE
jgi:hypothetical protein